MSAGFYLALGSKTLLDESARSTALSIVRRIPMKPFQLRYLRGMEALNRQYAIDEAAARAQELARKLKDRGDRRERPKDSNQEAI
jgi:hypothetical protein